MGFSLAQGLAERALVEASRREQPIPPTPRHQMIEIRAHVARRNTARERGLRRRQQRLRKLWIHPHLQAGKHAAVYAQFQSGIVQRGTRADGYLGGGS